MLVKTGILASMAIGSFAAPTSSSVTHERRASHETHRSIRRGERANGLIPVKIALKQNNLEHGYKHLMDVSDPASPNYGKHWTAQQVNDRFAPSDESSKSVKDWLISSGVSSNRIANHDNKGWLSVKMTTDEAEKLFNTKYFEYEHRDGSVRVGNEGYDLPEKISAHVDYITPGPKLSAPLKKKTLKKRTPKALRSSHRSLSARNSTSLENCSYTLTPDCLRAMYEIPEAPSADPVDTVGVYERSDNVYDQADLDSYYKMYTGGKVPKGTAPSLQSVDGGKAPGPQKSAGFESNLDLEILESLIYPQKITLYEVVDSEDDGFLETWLDSMDGSFCNKTVKADGYDCGTITPARVVSVSWGSDEDYEPPAYQQRACNEFMKLGLQGHTFVVSSGDYGVGQGIGCAGPKNTTFSPGFPTNCPYILSVGATQYTVGDTIDKPEGPMNQPISGPHFSTGGGFANLFARPSYQDEAVSTYFKNHDPGYDYYSSGNDLSKIGANGGLYNRDGRGFPDVSANGAMFGLVSNGSETVGSGTSLSTPVWASILTLINQERTKSGKGPVGFVNPTLYKNAKAFTDIRGGANNANCGTKGFPAVEGWDPSTGLGTPNYPKLRDIFTALP